MANSIHIAQTFKGLIKLGQCPSTRTLSFCFYSFVSDTKTGMYIIAGSQENYPAVNTTFPAVKHYFFLQNVFKCHGCQKIVIYFRQVQKSDRINSDRQSGSDQLGSTRIDSDRLGSSQITKKHKIKWNIKTFTHLKIKFWFKMGHIKKNSRHFSVSCCVVKLPFCIVSTSSSQRLPKLKIRGVCHSLCI